MTGRVPSCEHAPDYCRGWRCCCADTHPNPLHRAWWHLSFRLPWWVPGSALIAPASAPASSTPKSPTAPGSAPLGKGEQTPGGAA